MKKYIWGSFILVALIAVSAVSAIKVNAQGSSTYNPELTGWAWSSNIGWISFNGSNSGAGGGNYKVVLTPTGALDGWAWSSNIGWIKFGGLNANQMPAGGGVTNNAMVDMNSTANVRKVSGWVRACSGTVNGDCNSASRTDGWDGWISLSGPSNSTYPSADRFATQGQYSGVSYVKEGDTAYLRGYAWGGPVLGWVKFSPTLDVPTTFGPYSQPQPSFNLIASTNSVPINTDVTLTWQKQNIESCEVVQGQGYSSWSNVQVTSGTGHYESSESGNGKIKFTTNGTYQMGLRCFHEGFEGEIVRSVTIVVSTPTIACVQPTRSLTCTSGEEGASPQFIYGSDIPSGQSSTNLVNSCPTSGTHYCTYICEPGFRPNSSGTMCLSASFEER